MSDEPTVDDTAHDEAARAGTGPPGPRADAPAEPDAGARQRILDAAASVFREKGFTGTRVVDIARRAGYTSGALYGYFENRAELLAEAIAAAASENLEHLLTTPDGASVDPVGVLTAVFDQLPEPIGDGDQMLLDGVAIAGRQPVAGHRLAAALGEFRTRLQDPGGLTSEAADLVVVLVLGVTAARALGLHDGLPPSLGESIVESLGSPAVRSATG